MFPARKLCVQLHAPLQTMVKKTREMTESTKTTGVQKGKTIVEFIYDTKKWIDKPKHKGDDDLSSSSSDNTNVS